MNPLVQFANYLGKMRMRVKDAYNFPTISGGLDIFRQFAPSWADSWSGSKGLTTYRKSLYVFACVSKIAEKTASIDWQLFRIKNTKGDKVEVIQHEAIDLLYKPNPFQTKEEFFKRFVINKKLTGCAFILKVRDESGTVRELWNLRPDYMRLLIDTSDVRLIKGYEFTANGKAVVFAPEDVIYDSDPDPLSDFGGMSALQPAQARVDTEEFATKYQRNFFVNNARPDFILTTEKKVSADQKEEIKGAWSKRHRAGEDQKNVGNGAFLEAGMQYQQVSISQKEMDYIESIKATRDDILTAFGVPKPIVAITEDVNYANAETAMKVFLSETIVPLVRQLTNKLNENLIYPEFGDLFYIEFVDPVPENQREKAEVQGMRLTSGTLLINEAREEWGDEPIMGGNSLYMPLGMVAVGGISSKPTKAKGNRAATVFRGRGKAYRILTAVGLMKKALIRDITHEIKEEKKPKKFGLIKAEIRKEYVNIVLKGIDQKGDVMEKPLLKFMDEQQARALKALKLGRKDVSEKMPEDWKGALNSWAKDEKKLATGFVLPFLEEFVKQAGKEALLMVAPAEDFDMDAERVQKYLKERSKEFGKQTTATTLDYLKETLAEGIAADEGIVELQNRVESVYEEFPLYRARMIARTEATSANNRGFVEAYDQSGVANAKEWIAANDDRTRDSHIATDGEIVKLDENFSNGLEYPGDSRGGPEETINCRCVVAPAFAE